jgi:hypothetical protein
MGFGVLGAFAVVCIDSLKSVTGIRRFPPRQNGLIDGGPATSAPEPGIPVFVMLPLDGTQPTCPIEMRSALEALVKAGTRGVMVDVWWGLCEKKPRVYDFDHYRTLANLCKELGLLVQATMSFHACGGNVGDTVNVPLPEWVLRAGDEHDLWYVDRQGHRDRECLSLSADTKPVLPCGEPASYASESVQRLGTSDHGALRSSPAGGASMIKDPSSEASAVTPDSLARKSMDAGAGPRMSSALEEVAENQMRTAIDAYRQFMAAFLDAMGNDLVGSTVVELQVGCGPCGELRYPSYPMAGGMWAFPGMGEFQCFEPYMLLDLANTAATAGHPTEWGDVPADTGSYNAKPMSSKFFSRGFKQPRGQFFMAWYANSLLEHGRRMLGAASAATEKWQSVTLAVKISGIHWWRFTSSRAAEATAGYYISSAYNSYAKIAAMLKEFEAVLDFTCLEMRTFDQPFLRARCGPYQLVKEVFKNARDAGVRVAGENALERYDLQAYNQIVKAFRHVPIEHAYGFTMLRLGKALLEDDHMALFKQFVLKMKKTC